MGQDIRSVEKAVSDRLEVVHHGGFLHRPIRAVRPYMSLLPWGQHTRVLIAAGLTYIGAGLTYMVAEPTPSREVALQLALKWLPLEIWGGIIAAIGVLTIISSRWPPVTKKWGYVLLTGFAAGWASTYALGVIIAGAPPQNLSGAFLWGNFAYMWYVISGLTEHSGKECPTRLRKEPHGCD